MSQKLYKQPATANLAILKSKILEELNGISSEKWDSVTPGGFEIMAFENSICLLLVEWDSTREVFEYSFHHKTLKLESFRNKNPTIGYLNLKTKVKELISGLQLELKKF